MPESRHPTNHELRLLTATLRRHAQDYELGCEWPLTALHSYQEVSGWRWGVPRSHGGLALHTVERLRGYIALARGDMSSALFITQHEGAVDLIVSCDNEPLRAQWLPRYANGEALTTIGYSQLTTSRQGGAPAMRATGVPGGYRLDGVMPWVTGAPFVTNVACGATLEDGRQLLTLVALDDEGVTVEPAELLAALNSTHTCVVGCDNVFSPSADVIAGPVNAVLSTRSSLRLLLVSATGVGLALGMLDELEDLAGKPGYGLDASHFARASAHCSALEARVLTLGEHDDLDQSAIDALRIDTNAWLLRLAGVLMVAAKGTGYRETAVAQRLAREAMFFCVWSASNRVRELTIAELLAEPAA